MARSRKLMDDLEIRIRVWVEVGQPSSSHGSPGGPLSFLLMLSGMSRVLGEAVLMWGGVTSALSGTWRLHIRGCRARLWLLQGHHTDSLTAKLLRQGICHCWGEGSLDSWDPSTMLWTSVLSMFSSPRTRPALPSWTFWVYENPKVNVKTLNLLKQKWLPGFSETTSIST